MKNISDYSVEQLLFNVPLYEKINIDILDIESGSRTETMFNYDYKYTYDESIYEEKYPKEFKFIIDFLSSDENIYGYCNKCRRENSLKLTKVKLDDKLLENVLHGQCGDDFDDYDDTRARYELNNKVELLMKNNRYFTKTVCCSHDNSHKLLFIYKLDFISTKNDEKILTLEKIGQDPSNVELYSKKLNRKYDKYNNYKGIKTDLNKAIISFSNNFGVGGFLYLRRVLEKVVDYKYNEVKENLEEDKQKKFEEKMTKFSEKLDILKDELPNHLTENKYIYSILSAGVHSLTEEQCMEYFPVVEKSTYIIIDGLLELQKRRKLHSDIENNLNKINSKIKME